MGIILQTGPRPRTSLALVSFLPEVSNELGSATSFCSFSALCIYPDEEEREDTICSVCILYRPCITDSLIRQTCVGIDSIPRIHRQVPRNLSYSMVCNGGSCVQFALVFTILHHVVELFAKLSSYLQSQQDLHDIKHLAAGRFPNSISAKPSMIVPQAIAVKFWPALRCNHYSNNVCHITLFTIDLFLRAGIIATY